jgi:leucyl aminopeptidase (aminopeptidase T)
MKKLIGYAALGILVVMGVVAATPAARRAVTPGPDREAVAAKMVRQCAGVHENDLVVITGSVREMTLLENLAVQTRKLGAQPLVVVGSDRLAKRMYDDVPASFDSQTPAWGMKLAETASVYLSVDNGSDPALLAQVPAQRVAAQNAAGAPVYLARLQHGVRQVWLGNGLYPTAGLARQFGIPLEQLTRTFWDGVNTDYDRLQQIGTAVRKEFEGGKLVHITNPNGTDIRARIEARPVFVSDGVISPDDVQKGGPACQVWLPAGEVYLSAVPETAEGTIVVEHSSYLDKPIEGLRLAFQRGRLVSMSAKSGLAPLKALYDASNEGKDLFSIIDVGINPGVKLPATGRLDAYMAAGMVSVNLGADDWAGGTNHSSFGWTCFLPGSTLTVDDSPVVEKGQLSTRFMAMR